MIDTYKYVVIAVLVLALAGMTNLYLGKRDQYAALEGTVRAFGEAAEKALKDKEDQGKENLAQIRKIHEDKIPEIRAAAVANYLAHRVRVTAPSGGPMPNPSAGQPVDDDKICQPVPDTALIESAAEDAAKLEAWQDYARLNGIPVTE